MATLNLHIPVIPCYTSGLYHGKNGSHTSGLYPIDNFHIPRYTVFDVTSRNHRIVDYHCLTWLGCWKWGERRTTWGVDIGGEWRLKVSCPAFLPRHRKVFDEYVRLEPARRKCHGFSKWFFWGNTSHHTPRFLLLNVQMHLGEENHCEIWVGCKKRNLTCKES